MVFDHSILSNAEAANFIHQHENNDLTEPRLLSFAQKLWHPSDGIGIGRACQRNVRNIRAANGSERVAKRAIALSDAELFGVLVHVVSKFCGLLSRFAHRDRDASTKVSAGLVQPFVWRVPETKVARVVVADMDARSWRVVVSSLHASFGRTDVQKTALRRLLRPAANPFLPGRSDWEVEDI